MAVFVSQDVPRVMTAGQSYNVAITLRNVGNTTWQTTPDGYVFGSENPANNLSWGLNRVGLVAPVAPGEQVTLNLSVTAPAAPGTYNFQWRMLREGVEWFGDLTPNIPVQVRGVQPNTATTQLRVNGLGWNTSQFSQCLTVAEPFFLTQETPWV